MPTLLLRDHLDPRLPVIDRAQLGNGARFFEWTSRSWRPFSDQARVLIPMTPWPRHGVYNVAEFTAAHFRGGQIIVYETDPPEAVTIANVLEMAKTCMGPARRSMPEFVYLGLVYTRIREWREILRPLAR